MSKYEKIKDLDLPYQSVVVYCYLYERADKKGECWSAVPTIARDIKLSESTVRRGIKDLIKGGVIKIEQRYRTKGWKSSFFKKLL